MQEMLRVMGHMGVLAVDIMNDTNPLLKKGLRYVSEREQEDIIKKYQTFQNLREAHSRRKDKIKEYLPKLLSAFSKPYQTLSDKEAADLIIKRMTILAELYRDEDFFLKPNSDPFTFIRDFGNSTNEVLRIYEKMVEEYNEQVEKEDEIKKSILFFSVLLTAYLTYLKARRKSQT